MVRDDRLDEVQYRFAAGLACAGRTPAAPAPSRAASQSPPGRAARGGAARRAPRGRRPPGGAGRRASRGRSGFLGLGEPGDGRLGLFPRRPGLIVQEHQAGGVAAGGGRSKPQTARKKASGIWVRMPAPSPVSGSLPSAPRCWRLRRAVSALATTSWLGRPDRSATKPTPQASCSKRLSYSPGVVALPAGAIRTPVVVSSASASAVGTALALPRRPRERLAGYAKVTLTLHHGTNRAQDL